MIRKTREELNHAGYTDQTRDLTHAELIYVRFYQAIQDAEEQGGVEDRDEYDTLMGMMGEEIEERQETNKSLKMDEDATYIADLIRSRSTFKTRDELLEKVQSILS